MTYDDWHALYIALKSEGVATLADLSRWKAQHNANTNSQTLQAMAKARSRSFYFDSTSKATK